MDYKHGGGGGGSQTASGAVNSQQEVGELLYWVSRHFKQQAHLKKEKKQTNKQTDNQDQHHNITVRVI